MHRRKKNWWNVVENEALWLLERMVRCVEQRGIRPEALGDHLNQL